MENENNTEELLLFFDTETSKMILWDQPSEAEEQPHIVQLAAVLAKFDGHGLDIIQSIDVIIRPEGWIIDQEAQDVHKISLEYARKVGVHEEMAVLLFLEMWLACNKRIGHNQKFDERIIRIAMKRMLGPDEPMTETWAAGESECTMMMTTPILKLPKKNGKSGYKWPTLEEAYEYYSGKKMENAHNAMADVMATIAVWLSAKRALPGYKNREKTIHVPEKEIITKLH